MTFALSGLKIGMFGDGTLSWPEFYFEWTTFTLGLIGAIVLNWRTFIDQSMSEEERALGSKPHDFTKYSDEQ